MDYDSVLAAIDAWSIEDRLRLINDLQDLCEGYFAQPALSEATKAELERRIAVLDKDPNRVVAWEDVDARIRSRYPQ